MRTIFVVNHESGNYDDYRCYPILATFNEGTAKTKVTEMELRKIRREEILEQLNSHMSAWDSANPRPKFPDFRQDVLPLFPGKQKTWTKEQKEIYRKAKEDISIANAARAKPYGDWARERYDEQQRFMQGLSDQEKNDYTEISGDSSWSIDTIPFEE